MSHNSALAYRPDIDGLRAIAVLSVVLYHFGIGGLSGGFVGVDVFFVISGFLIAGIIKREIDDNKFTFSGFYERRIRRIFPALFAVMAVTMLLGYFILLPTDMVLLGKSSLATLFFFSNVFYWRNSGYFDSVSDLNPLLHTWSLAVEEQFYLIFPIFLLFAHRYAKNVIKPLVALAVVSSFILCFWQQAYRPTATFYLLPFRAWELGLGAAAGLGMIPILGRWASQISAWIGLLLIVVGIIYIPSGDTYPGWHALVPVIGSLLVIQAGSSYQTMVSKVLSIPPLVSIGLVSYSLYLWHWPILVLTQYIGAIGQLSNWVLWLALMATFIVSYASYQWIEKPFRRKNSFDRKRINKFAGIAAALLVFTSISIHLTKGFPERFSDEVVSADKQRDQFIAYRGCFGKGAGAINDKSCYLGRNDIGPSIVLIGDSHAASIAPAFDKLLREANIAGLVVPTRSCPPLINVGTTHDPECVNNNNEIFALIKSNPKIKLVILHGFWVSYTGRDAKNGSPKNWIYVRDQSKLGHFSFENEIKRTVDYLLSIDKMVLLIGPVSESPMSVNDIAFSRIRNKELEESISWFEFRNKKADIYFSSVDSIKNKNIEIFEPSFYLCHTGNCDYVKDGDNLFRDHNHLSVSGAEYLAPFIREKLKKFDLKAGTEG